MLVYQRVNHQELCFFSPEIVKLAEKKKGYWYGQPMSIYFMQMEIMLGKLRASPGSLFQLDLSIPLAPFFWAPRGDTAQVVLMALGLWRTSRDAPSRSLVDVNDALVPFVHHWIGLRQFKGHVIEKPHTSWSCW